MSTYAGIGFISEEDDLNATYIRRDDYIAKGQLGTYNTAVGDFDLLPPGTNGYVLSADSLSTYGLTWIPAPDGLASVPTQSWGAGTGRNLTAAVNSISIGHNSSVANRTSAVSVGHTAICNGNTSVAIGASVQAGLQATAVNGFANVQGGTSVGYLCASLAQDAVTLGNNCRTSGLSNVIVGVGNGSNAVTGNSNTFIGSQNANTVLTTGAANTMLGNNCSVTAANCFDSIAIGTAVVTSQNCVTIGILAAANAGSDNSVIIGRQAVGSADACIAIGYLTGTALVYGARCVLIGQQATANTAAVDAIAIGSSAFAGGNFSIAIGSGASVGTEGVSLGGFTTAARNTVGGTLTVSQAANSTLWGYNQRCGAGATTSILYGYNNGRDLMTGNSNCIFGSTNLTTVITTGVGNCVFGTNNNVSAAADGNVVNIGASNTTASGAIGIGSVVAALGASSVCLGAGVSASAAATSSVVIGTSANSEGASNVTIGHLSKNRTSQGIVIGFKAGNNTNTASNNVIIGQSAGQSTSAAQNSIFGASADVSSGRSHCTALGYLATASQNQCVVVGSSSSCTALNSNAFGYDVDNTTTNTTRIGSNKSTDHIVDSEGLFRSVRQLTATGTGTAVAYIGVGPINLAQSVQEFSYPAGLVDTVNNWIFLSAVGTECAGRTYEAKYTLLGTASANNTRWVIRAYVNEPGIAGTPRQIGWSACDSTTGTTTACNGSYLVQINAAITGRPYIYFTIERAFGVAASITADSRCSVARYN